MSMRNEGITQRESKNQLVWHNSKLQGDCDADYCKVTDNATGEQEETRQSNIINGAHETSINFTVLA
jgi:hypothetical protein